MRILDPVHDRVAFTDALRPPAGFVLGACVGTTYSLNFDAFTAVVLAFVGADLDDSVDDSPSVLTAVTRLRSRLRVFVNAGGLHAPGTPNRLFALYDRVLRPVRLDASAFHPKVWALRFDPVLRPEVRQAPALYRVLCASRNVTDSGCWELGATLEGKLGSRHDDFGASVGRFCRRFAKSKNLPKDIWKLLSELPQVEFERNRESETGLDFRWQWPGETPLRHHLPKRARRALVISPFVRADFVRDVCSRVDDFTLVSTQTELDALPDHAHDLLRTARTYVVTDTEAASEDIPPLDLHAKLLAWESDDDSETLVGSANATGAAWGLSQRSNCEAMVSLQPGLRIDEIFRAFVSPMKGQLHSWIEEYERRTPEPDEDEAAQQRLQLCQRELSSDELRGTFDRSTNILVLRCTGGRKRQPLPEGVRAEIVPLLQRITHDWRDYSEVHSRGARFADIRLEDLSAFALVRLRDERRDDVALEFGIQFDLEGTEQEADARDDAVNKRLLEGVDTRALLLSVLRGLPAGTWRTSAPRSGSGASRGSGSLLGHATLERVLESCTADPSRIDAVDTVLRACADSSDMETFRQFWKSFQNALREIDRV